MQVTYLWIFLAVIAVLLDLWVLNSLWRSDNSSGSKAGWTGDLVAYIVDI